MSRHHGAYAQGAGSGLNLTPRPSSFTTTSGGTPPSELRATDRAYRIGTTVDRHYSASFRANTQEKINQIIEEKKRLTEMTVEPGSDLSNEELAHVFNMAVDEEDEEQLCLTAFLKGRCSRFTTRSGESTGSADLEGILVGPKTGAFSGHGEKLHPKPLWDGLRLW